MEIHNRVVLDIYLAAFALFCLGTALKFRVQPYFRPKRFLYFPWHLKEAMEVWGFTGGVQGSV
jgi:hypothetical protein